MGALREIRAVRQNAGEHSRRWFTSEDLDLYVWVNESDTPVKFQLCYDKVGVERALTWSQDRGFAHDNVDAGETGGLRHKAAAVLIADGVLDATRLAKIFSEAAKELPAEIHRFVMDKLVTHPSYGRGA